jgi:uncharacterized protein (DUF2147 family)
MVANLRLIAALVTGFAVALASVDWTYAAEPSVNGLWEQVGDDGQVGGWFMFYEREGHYEGALVRAFSKPGEPQYDVCSECKSDQKNAPMMGLVIVKDMQKKGLIYENGSILDPRDGSVYKAKMELSPDGQRLMVRGFLGIELFGQTQVWRRLPDASLPRNEIPENIRPYVTAAGPPAAGQRPAGTAANPRTGTTGSIPRAGTTGAPPRPNTNNALPRPGASTAR